MSLKGLRAALRDAANPERAKVSVRYFKTGVGEYGENDVFLGVSVPAQRKLARQFRQLPLSDVVTLLRSRLHEERLTALLILVEQFKRGDAPTRQRLCDLYLAERAHVNNWDLVDTSAPYLLGAQLLSTTAAGKRPILTELATATCLWDRRIALLATQAFIRAGEHRDTFALAERLLDDPEDLIHKATGWMLREVGERVGADLLRGFLRKHHPRMARTALRYAIEKFSPTERKRWLAGEPNRGKAVNGGRQKTAPRGARAPATR